jgi:hypothetical protein
MWQRCKNKIPRHRSAAELDEFVFTNNFLECTRGTHSGGACMSQLRVHKQAFPTCLHNEYLIQRMRKNCALFLNIRYVRSVCDKDTSKRELHYALYHTLRSLYYVISCKLVCYCESCSQRPAGKVNRVLMSCFSMHTFYKVLLRKLVGWFCF